MKVKKMKGVKSKICWRIWFSNSQVIDSIVIEIIINILERLAIKLNDASKIITRDSHCINFAPDFLNFKTGNLDP